MEVRRVRKAGVIGGAEDGKEERFSKNSSKRPSGSGKVENSDRTKKSTLGGSVAEVQIIGQKTIVKGTWKRWRRGRIASGGMSGG